MIATPRGNERFAPNCRSRRIVLKNPKNGRCPKSCFGAAFAFLDARRAYIEATELVRRRPQSNAGSLANKSRAASLASVVVIEPKIGVFQHNLRKRDRRPESTT
jgi:hypothetical protein